MSWPRLQSEVLQDSCDCLQMYSLSSHSALSKPLTVLRLGRISAYTTLLEVTTPDQRQVKSHWGICKQIWIKRCCNDLRTKNTMLKTHLPLQKDGASALTVNIINTEKNSDYSPSHESSLFSNKMVTHNLAGIVHILKVRCVIPCKASGTRTKSFAHHLASWSYEPAESCMQQVIILTNIQPTYLWQNWSNITITPEDNWPDQIFISMTTDHDVQKCF